MKKSYLLFSFLFCIQWSQGQVVNIPDTHFKNYLLNTIVVDTNDDYFADSSIDINNDGEIQESEALLISGINLNYLPVESLEGIQYFTNLEALSCREHRISTLDLSQNINLVNVTIYGNTPNLTHIDVSGCVNLERLNLNANYSLENLDVTQNINLKELEFSSCDITEIDVTQNLDLEFLDCSRTYITSLDVSQNPNLTELNCSFLNLQELDVTQNINLIDLDFYSNAISTIDLTQNTELKKLRIGSNDLSIVDLSQNVNLVNLDCSGSSFTDINLSNNINLTSLTISNSQLPTIDISNNVNLKVFTSYDSEFTSLDVSQNVNLERLTLFMNNLTSIDISNNVKLIDLNCYDNMLTMLDASNNPLLKRIQCSSNQLEYINVKNGINSSVSEFRYSGNPNLEFLCADEEEITFISTNPFLPDTAVVSTYCSFSPGGDFITLQGTTKLDLDSNGCDLNDAIFPSMEYHITLDSVTETIIADISGDYTIYLPEEDTYTITPQLENPNYFTISPTSITIDTETISNLAIQDFCVIPNGTHNDVEVIIIPLEEARPGFDTTYQITYQNKGNTTLSGAVVLTFDDELMDLVTSNPISDLQTVNTFTWNYVNLAPFESRNVIFTMNIHTPTDVPAVNGGDVLSFEVMVNPTVTDETPDNNIMALQQTVVNSFDPNDIRCLEGGTVTTDYIGKYVHYLIRFENTGTASAVNVVVTDEIDQTKFDINTLMPITSSHEMVISIKDQNKVEFIFENINLPFDDATNDGYLVFKVKTLTSLEENDTFDNTANIYFDFNLPITTNTATTLIADPLSVSEENLETGITLYPNPAKEQVHITSISPIETIELHSLDGRRIHSKNIQTTSFSSTVEVSYLPKGIYLMNITTTKGKAIRKIVKQ
ncbi:T9SS type A sorting domain-containing protein [uncultured Kordia sp.]|uniref:DUF7619 domain-containing protein n=1 Tax=uncultured Kordia sp. TaxID=507699 RepID=UPI002614AED6|nr:T9SS type A sorting domain-containing protein [uncultured Kordia sp.]